MLPAPSQNHGHPGLGSSQVVAAACLLPCQEESSRGERLPCLPQTRVTPVWRQIGQLLPPLPHCCLLLHLLHQEFPSSVYWRTTQLSTPVIHQHTLPPKTHHEFKDRRNGKSLYSFKSQVSPPPRTWSTLSKPLGRRTVLFLRCTVQSTTRDIFFSELHAFLLTLQKGKPMASWLISVPLKCVVRKEKSQHSICQIERIKTVWGKELLLSSFKRRHQRTGQDCEK